MPASTFLRFALALGFAATFACEITDDGDGNGDDGTGADDGNDDGNGDGNDDGNGDGNGDGNDDGSGPSPAAETDCKNVCDNLLNADCDTEFTVDDHATCFTRCSSSNDDAIELFTSCYFNTAADCGDEVECYENFVGSDPVDPNPTTCLDACNAYIGAGCASPIEGVDSCAEFCAGLTEAFVDVVVMCLNDAVDCVLPQECMLPGG
ncbi:MAG: hypothetical protein AAF721_07530 [Myxococcota bacterium]